MLQILNTVNRCQITELEKKGRELDPGKHGSCEEFAYHVRNVQAVIMHTYQISAFRALQEKEPSVAAQIWKEVSELCNAALNVLRTLKDVYSGCGTPELYDLTLDYKTSADKRYYQNLQDAECCKNPIPKGLFPNVI